MKCNICKSESDFLFKELILNKYQVSYYKCSNCEFIQTEKPYWMKESYNNAITDLDIGLLSRNIKYAEKVEQTIKKSFDYKKKFLDYAGGYGLFARLMRDKGFDFYREDKYCENIFAKNYDLELIEEGISFELLTAFELFEHLESPMGEIEKMLEYSDTIIFSTEVHHNQKFKSCDDWWYFVPETGQHISFYSEKTLQFIAQKLKLNYFSADSLHIFSKRSFASNPLLVYNGLHSNLNIKSLADYDFKFAKNILSKVCYLRREAQEDILDSSESSLIKKISVAQVRLDKVAEELAVTKTALIGKQQELLGVYSSREWRAILRLKKIFKLFFPVNSLRRAGLIKIFLFAKGTIGIILKIKKTIITLALEIKNYLIRLKPKKKRKINLRSRKLVYIGHSYHNKTKSTAFLIEYLKEFFDVEVILDESWQGGPAPDLSFIDKSYLGVIFFQLLPSPEIIRSIKNDNIIYFPMYDQSGRLDLSYWNNYWSLKIINFSSTLHEKLKKWRFESMYVQYFPKPQDFIPGNKGEAFFWQRLTNISVSTIIKLLNKESIKIHIHKAIDPDQKFIQPTEKDEKKFQITYSEWFNTREEMWNVIKQKGVYIAPREYEGIGMSFLEAMAMGKAVIAVNNPTMNEYIEDGKTGYLYNLKNPKEIDLSNIEEVQKNTHKYMQEGYQQWEKDKKKIIEFIKKP